MEDEWTLVLDSTLLPRADRPASVRLHEDAITVLGRDQAHVDVLLDSAQFPALISRTHAKLELRRGARPVLVDCSLNGVAVDGKRAKRGVPMPIHEGASVVFGPAGSQSEFRYVAKRGGAKRARCEGARCEGARRDAREEGAEADGESASVQLSLAPNDAAVETPAQMEAHANAAKGVGKTEAAVRGGSKRKQNGVAAAEGVCKGEGGERDRVVAAEAAEHVPRIPAVHARADAASAVAEADAGTCQAEAEAGTSQAEVEAGTSQAEVEAGTCQAEAEAGTCRAEVSGVLLGELQCCVCHELLCRPHTLPCTHTFCAHCIFEWERRGDRTCVVCRAPLPEAPPLLVRALDDICTKLAGRVLVDAERSDFLERQAFWDCRAAAAKEEWGSAPAKALPKAQEEPEVRLVADYARSARSTCRRCLERIPVGELRLGVQSFVPMFGTSQVAWHHKGCLPLRGRVRGVGEIGGVDELRPRDRAFLERRLAE